MSRSGIMVSWKAGNAVSSLPQPGDLLTVEIELPASQTFGRRCMHCQAVVTRVLAGEEARGPRVALQVSQMQFRSYANGRRAVPDEAGVALM